MDPVTWIAIGTSVYRWLHNLDQEEKKRKDARRRYDAYYNDPMRKLAQQELRKRYQEHGIDPNEADKFFIPRPFNEDSDEWKNPGAGTAAIEGLADAGANEYKSRKANREVAGPPGSMIVGGASVGRPGLPALPGGDGSAGAGAPLDATRNDPQAIFESIFGPGEVSPVNVSDPSQPWIDPLRRFYYPGKPQKTQGL